MPETMTLDERRELLRYFRKETDLTLEDLGDRAKLSKAMLSQFENGNRDLSEEAWGRLVDAMEKFLLEDRAVREKEIARLEREGARLEKKLADQSINNAGMAFLEKVPGGALGQFLTDMLCPMREGAAERRRTIYEDIQRRYGTDGPALLQELDQVKQQNQQQRDFISMLLKLVEKYHIQNAELREWLDAEMIAALATDKALELRGRIHQEEASRQGQGSEPEIPLSLRLLSKAVTGTPISKKECDEASALGQLVKQLKLEVKVEDGSKESSDE